MEATKWLKPSVSVSRIGDSASVQAGEHRASVERDDAQADPRPFRGRLIRGPNQGTDASLGISVNVEPRPMQAARIEAPALAQQQRDASDGHHNHQPYEEREDGIRVAFHLIRIDPARVLM
jgi:hypothetical protein